MKAYVLAAGYAKRMYPLTRDLPKALLEVGGAPILTHILDCLRVLDCLTDVVIVTNDRFYGHFQQWSETLEPWARFTLLNDGTTSNDGRLGALGDLRLALEHEPPDEDGAVVLASDNLFDMDLRPVQREFRAAARTTLVVRRVQPDSGPSRYNEVTLADDGRIEQFREKPAEPRTDLAAIALYFFQSADLERLDEYLQHGSCDAPGHFLAWLVERVPCYASRLSGSWYDIGSLESLAEARARFGEGRSVQY